MTKDRKLIESIFEQPAYSMKDASRYLRIPYPTLRDWVKGFPRSNQRPIITIPDKMQKYLSFINLVEIYVLDAIRRIHKISFPKIRKALLYLNKKIPSKHPLADHLFSTDGYNLFVDEYGQLTNISKDGQIEMKKIIETYLKRVERNYEGIPIRLYPFVRNKSLDEPKDIIIDPMISFGRPILAGTGIPASVIFERFIAGDSISDLAKDYGIEQEKVEDAIRCEQEIKAA